jgi:hypothetical protein
MPSKRSRQWIGQRPIGNRRYRRIIVVATEGRETERQYFSPLNNVRSTVRLLCLNKSDQSAPDQVLRRMKTYLAQKGLKPDMGDEAWIVVDVDRWGEDALQRLNHWASSQPYYGLAVSNPCFEVWLLLHFEDGQGAATAATIKQRLKRHAASDGKHLRGDWVTETRALQAITRARARDTPPCNDWPRNAPATTVYRLVEKFLTEQT